MRRLLKYDLICYGAMSCVAVGVLLNIVFLQALNSDGPARLVLIPVGVGLAAPALVWTVRRLLRFRESRFLEAVAAGAVLYLLGSGLLSVALLTFLQPRPAA